MSWSFSRWLAIWEDYKVRNILGQDLVVGGLQCALHLKVTEPHVQKAGEHLALGATHLSSLFRKFRQLTFWRSAFEFIPTASQKLESDELWGYPIKSLPLWHNWSCATFRNCLQALFHRELVLVLVLEPLSPSLCLGTNQIQGNSHMTSTQALFLSSKVELSCHSCKNSDLMSQKFEASNLFVGLR